jgi:asparagine N-glycosylation enzyme membrane subunit Stt3
MSQKKPSLSATRSLIALLVLLVLAFTARSWVAYDYVFAQPDTTRLLGVDPFFHLRQSHYILNHYPHIQRHDDGTHFPVGLSSNANATGLFDIAIATVALVIYGADATINEVAAVAAWFVPVLSLLSGVSLYLLGKVLIGRSAGLVALCGFFLFPGQELDRSILGFADHHSAEAFLAIAIALGLVYLFKQERQSSPTSLPAWRQHQQ